jgi:IS1 family transposase
MNKLNTDKRAQILRCLCEGNSIRATARLVDCSINTVVKLLIDAGRACTEFQDKALQKLPCNRLQLDEVWTFVGAKDRNCTREQRAKGRGSAWVWTALCADTKLLATWFVGPRNITAAYHVLFDLKERLSSERVQITTDALHLYVRPIHSAFLGEADYAQLQKIYGAEPTGRYSPAQCMGSRRAVISGNPDQDHINTSYAERHHLNMRMSNRRFTRLTNAFSKKLKNLEHSVALYAMHYNFCRIHQTLRVTPAMAAGVTDHVWEMDEVIALLPN